MSSSKILRGEKSQSVAAAPWAAAAGDRPAPRRPSVNFPPQLPAAPEKPAEPPPPPEPARDFDGELRAAREAGVREGRQAAEQKLSAQVNASVEKLGRAVVELAGYKDRLRRDAERDVVQLAVEIARRLLHREISADPEAIGGLVRAALDKMEMREIQRIRMNPEHVKAVESVLKMIGSPHRVELTPDPGLEVGGVIFETARGAYDASVTTQLAEIEKGFAEIVQRRR